VDGFWGPNSVTQTLRYNGETSSGNWLYCSHYVNPGDANAPLNGNRQENRGTIDNSASGIGLYSSWSYAWPLNRRIIYNGASVYQTGHPSVGQPLAPSKWVVAWDAGGTATRAGGDVSDGFTPPGGAAPRYPFIMHREGHAHLFGPGRADGPFPEHYEPWETVLTSNPLSTGTLTSPTNFGHARPEAYEHPGHGNPDFPIVGTTYRVSEHWQAGQLTRNNPWLCQLQPDVFVELSEELAILLGIVNGDMVELKTQRTELYGKRMNAVACVTKRFTPYTIDGGTVHHIGAIWHFGYTGHCTGDSANLLTPHIGDANTGIPESKAFICNIRKIPGGAYL
jgi:formate dehydrogenase major subunit